MSEDFGLWDVIVSMLWFGLLMAWIWMIIAILGDLFRDQDLGGGAKALWATFIVVIPWLGCLCYIFARGSAMNERARERAVQQQERMAAYYGAAAPAGPTVADELQGLAELRDKGAISPAEFEAAKAKVLT